MSDPNRGAATASRVSTVAPVLLADSSAVASDADLGTLLDAVVRSVKTSLDPAAVWLLYTAVTGRFPDAEETLETRRVLQLLDHVDAAHWLMERALHGAGDTRGWRLELLQDKVVVDVDFSARHDLHTGIQRVVRSTLPHWADHPDVVPVVWTDAASVYRRCTADESARVLRWGHRAGEDAATDPATTAPTPWSVSATTASRS